MSWERTSAARYEQPPSTEERCTVLEHCRRAFALYGRRGTGAHGLPLMLDGDWNDGMDAVGRAGRGESVWLAWFHAHTAREFAGVLEEEGLAAEAEKLRRSAGESARRRTPPGTAAGICAATTTAARRWAARGRRAAR